MKFQLEHNVCGFASAFVDFSHIYLLDIGQNKAHQSSLSASEIVFTTGFFSYKEIILAERKSQ